MAMAGTTVREYGAYAPQGEEVVAHAMSLDSALGLEGGLRLVPQAGEGKGRGLLASKAFEQGFVVFQDDPIAALHQNKDECWACERCLRVMGSASDRESWLARRSDSGEAGGSGSSSSKPDRAPRPVRCRGGMRGALLLRGLRVARLGSLPSSDLSCRRRDRGRPNAVCCVLDARVQRARRRDERHL